MVALAWHEREDLFGFVSCFEIQIGYGFSEYCSGVSVCERVWLCLYCQYNWMHGLCIWMFVCNFIPSARYFVVFFCRALSLVILYRMQMHRWIHSQYKKIKSGVSWLNVEAQQLSATGLYVMSSFLLMLFIIHNKVRCLIPILLTSLIRFSNFPSLQNAINMHPTDRLICAVGSVVLSPRSSFTLMQNVGNFLIATNTFIWHDFELTTSVKKLGDLSALRWVCVCAPRAWVFAYVRPPNHYSLLLISLGRQRHIAACIAAHGSISLYIALHCIHVYIWAHSEIMIEWTRREI